jgi:hypothetical protein
MPTCVPVLQLDAIEPVSVLLVAFSITVANEIMRVFGRADIAVADVLDKLLGVEQAVDEIGVVVRTQFADQEPVCLKDLHLSFVCGLLKLRHRSPERFEPLQAGFYRLISIYVRKVQSVAFACEWQAAQFPVVSRNCKARVHPSNIKNSQSPVLGLKPASRLTIAITLFGSGFNSSSCRSLTNIDPTGNEGESE